MYAHGHLFHHMECTLMVWNGLAVLTPAILFSICPQKETRDVCLFQILVMVSKKFCGIVRLDVM